MTIYEDEIDLRPYINILIKNWWKIGIFAVLLASLVFVFTILQPPSYQATATMLLPRSQLQLSLADQFPTVVDAGDSRSRMEAYLTIAQSDAIAQQVYQAFEDVFPEGYTITSLRNNVEISNTGDAILIAVTAPTAQLAADVANEWANNTVQAINLAYSGEQPLEEIQLQIAAADEKYLKTQQELETFIETNPITEIQTMLEIAETALQSYKTDQTWQIDYLYQQRQHYTQLSDLANFIKNQVENGNASTAGDVGDALAIMNARAGNFSTYTPSLAYVPSDFSIQITDPVALLDTSSNYTRDMEALIQLSEEASQQIDQEISATTESASPSVDETLTTEIQTLKAQLESLTARERELTSERDFAWDTYQVLLQKETEIKTTAQTSAVVTFASPAIPPSEPESNQTLMKTALAGIMGAMIGALWFIARLWWQSSQLLEEDDSITPQA
jgi:uncharacterized protein involved in exopolysaccharide biosynthesis